MLEVIPITPPACLKDQSNGKLSSSIYSSVAGINGTPTVTLVDPAMRAWKALSQTALRDGIVLAATSLADSYRTYAQQRTLFLLRYGPDLTQYGCKRWDSDGNGVSELWCKKDPSYATAAVPGQSNHGWGLAIDIANAAGARLDWLEAHAVSFGWSWELVPEEPWHIHYYSGDAIPAAVLAYEGVDDDMGTFVLSGFPDQPSWTQDAYHVADASPQRYHVAPREPGWNQACWPNAPRLKPNAPVPSKYNYFAVLRALFGPEQDPTEVPGGPVEVSEASLDEIEARVDRQLDEAFGGGVDS